MANWEVTLKEIEVYFVRVEAESESEAIEKAMDAIEGAEGKAIHHDDSDGEVDAVES